MEKLFLEETPEQSAIIKKKKNVIIKKSIKKLSKQKSKNIKKLQVTGQQQKIDSLLNLSPIGIEEKLKQKDMKPHLMSLKQPQKTLKKLSSA